MKKEKNQHWWKDYFEQYSIGEFINRSNINLEYYVRESMNNYANILKENLIELGYDSTKRNLKDFFITEKQINNLFNISTLANIVDLVSIENKIRYQWWGYTYILMDKLLGFNEKAYYQVGYSTIPYPKRFSWYLKTLIEDPDKRIFYRTGEKQIYGWIYDYLDDKFGMDYFQENGDFNYKLIKEKVKERFEFKIIAVFWSEAATKQSETELIEMGKFNIEDLKF